MLGGKKNHVNHLEGKPSGGDANRGQGTRKRLRRWTGTSKEFLKAARAMVQKKKTSGQPNRETSEEGAQCPLAKGVSVSHRHSEVRFTFLRGGVGAGRVACRGPFAEQERKTFLELYASRNLGDQNLGQGKALTK